MERQISDLCFNIRVKIFVRRENRTPQIRRKVPCLYVQLLLAEWFVAFGSQVLSPDSEQETVEGVMELTADFRKQVIREQTVVWSSGYKEQDKRRTREAAAEGQVFGQQEELCRASPLYPDSCSASLRRREKREDSGGGV